VSTDPVNIPPAEAALLRELNQLRADLTARHDETVHRLELRQAETDARMDANKAETIQHLEAIFEQTKETNGRLRKAELWIAGLKALGAFLVLLIPFAVVYLNNL
jgi:hypothetical protein